MKYLKMLIIAIAAVGLLVLVVTVVNFTSNSATVKSNDRFEEFTREESIDEAVEDEEFIADSTTEDVNIESTKSTEETTEQFVEIKVKDKLSDYTGNIVLAFNITEDCYDMAISSVYSELNDNTAIYVFGAGFSSTVPYVAYTKYNKEDNSFTDIDVDDVVDEPITDEQRDVLVFENRDARINSRK